MIEIGTAPVSWVKSKIRSDVFLILLVFLIPFHQRFYKFLQTFSQSLVNASWQVPEYFEIHLDAFLSDFILIGLIFWCLKKGMVSWKSFWQGQSKYLSLFLFCALASVINSNFASYPIPYWRWMHLALPAFLFFLFEWG
jgi:hypothetical protein